MKNQLPKAILATWLRAVHLDPAQLAQHQFLHGGVSGSRVYHVEGFAQPVVLKLTPESAPAYVRERARREVDFYQQLATRLPMAVPHLHGAFVEPDEGGSALLLRAYAPPLPSTAWTDAAYADVARQLAPLHAIYWGATERLAAFAWLRQHAPIAPQTIDDARQSWQALRREAPFQALFNAPRLRLLDHLLEGVARAPANAAALPYTLP